MGLRDEDRERLGRTFDAAAATYQEARPEYPEALFDRLIAGTGIAPGARLLEVGCASGKATLPLARRGFRITAIEPGPALAREARANLAEFDSVAVVEKRFENWAGPGEPFAVVYAATAWNWVDPEVRYEKAAEALAGGGWLALWDATHVFPEGGDPFFVDLQAVYEEIGEGLPPGAAQPCPGELPTRAEEIEASGRFDLVEVAPFDWEITCDAAGYIGLLDTFSGHIEMEPWQRDRLYGAIRERLASRPDGLVRRHWGAILHLAQRR